MIRSSSILSGAASVHTRLRLADQPLAAWLLCWIVLPNVGFCLLWANGAPPRTGAILVTGIVGIVLRRSPYAIRLAGFLGAMGYALVSYISSLFSLSTDAMFDSLGFLAELQPMRSPDYAIGAAVLVTVIGAASQALRANANFTGTPALGGAVAALLLTAAVDHLATLDTRGSYDRFAAADTPFTSSVMRSGFAAHVPDRRHLVLVVVEAMGRPLDPAARAYQLARLRQPDITARYTVSSGTTPYYGSTTNAEIRVLCGRWGNYREVLDHADAHCLPARLARSGYQTSAIHSFSGDFFQRHLWYPEIGFAHSIFREGLARDGARPCPGVFPGVCDRDVPAILYRKLRNARSPQFLYWLTLNSHLPVIADPALHTDRCAADAPASVRALPMVCRQFVLWREVQDQLAAQLVKPDFPVADILLVGDHMPPYFDRRQRRSFDPGEVPWILLRRKPATVAGHGGPATRRSRG